jgi:hypothetical protein
MVLQLTASAYEKLRPPIARETTAEVFEEAPSRTKEPRARSPGIEQRCCPR